MRKLKVSPFQARKTDPVNLYEFRRLALAAMLREGTAEPIYVMPDGDFFIIFDGNHRIETARGMTPPFAGAPSIELSAVVIENSEDIQTAQRTCQRQFPEEVDETEYEGVLAHLRNRAEFYDPLENPSALVKADYAAQR